MKVDLESKGLRGDRQDHTMSMTRREFSGSVGAGLALLVLGCGGDDQQAAQAHGDEDHLDKKNKNKANLATEPFLIGPVAKYREAGMYEQYKKDKGVWLISDGQSLVALSATCTHLACTTHWKAGDEQFSCPCHKSRFDFGGMNLEGSKAKRPLERCSVRLVETKEGEQVQVDPTRRLRQDKGEWSDPESQLSLV